MPRLSLNNVPCPNCGAIEHYVKNTLYEKGSYRRIRQRKCEMCGHSFLTRQEQEVVLNDVEITWPDSFRKSKLIEVKAKTTKPEMTLVARPG